MGRKVNISEVIELSNDFSTASKDLKANLKEVEKNIEELQSMETFTGKAANGAKKYFNDLHKTLLKSFDLLLTELEERMKSNLNSFEWDVDSSESAIIDSGYLQNTEKNINDDYEHLSEEQESIRETIANVSDISSVNQPFFYPAENKHDNAIKIITDLEEMLELYTNRDVENVSEIDELLHHIETTIKDTGVVTEDNTFNYFMGSTTPVSLLTLQGYNQEKHRDMIGEATESSDYAMESMDESSQEIALKILKDLDDGILEEDEYYAYLADLRMLNNEEDTDGKITEKFIHYVMDNIDGVSKDFQSNVLAGMIKERFLADGYKKFNSAELIKKMNAGKPGAGSFVKEQGKNLLKIGRAVTGGLIALTVGYGMYDDYMNTDKTLGEAGTKNIADGIVTGSFAGGATVIAFKAAAVGGSATPIGWAVIATVGTATLVSSGFNYAYDKNWLGLQSGLDWGGRKIDEAGEALSGVFKSINPFIKN